MEEQFSKKALFAGGLLLALVLGGLGGYYYGKSASYDSGKVVGYDEGYAKAESDIQQVQTAAANAATRAAADAANPFDIGNPLQNIEVNPFDKVKGVLNPFE